MDIKLTTKEQKIVDSINAFLQGYKDCKKEDRKEYIYKNAFMVRNIIAFKNIEPKNAYAYMSSLIIHNIIPFIVAKEDEDISDVAERIDNKTNQMLKELIMENKEKN